jgi:hypothetical protein
MEYLVVRRYQNPVARSLARVAGAATKTRRIPNGATAVGGVNGPARHVRNVSLPDGSARRPPTPRRANSIRMNGAGSSFEEDGESRLSGVSSVTGTENEGTATILRNLWEKSLDLSASQE